MAAPYKHYINGRWETGVTLCVSDNPSDLSDVVGEFVRADSSQAQQAIRAASEAREAWACSSAQRRCEALGFIGNELHARQDALGRLLAREEGKPLAEAVAEVARAAQIFQFFAAEALRLRAEPAGVVGLITPWNYPLALPAWTIAPALAHGNTVVFKPAELVPGCAWALAEIISRSGVPAGVFNLVMGSGRMVGKALVDSPLVNALSFAGSDATGAAILSRVSERGGKAQIEVGGKNPLLVLADADLEHAVECAVQGAFFSTGQRCTASSRLIVEAPLYARFVARLRVRTEALVVGHALQAGTEIGPVASAKQLAHNLSSISLAQSEGADLVCGGERLARQTNGHYLSPALFLADARHRIAQQAVFGPVACVLRADDEAHALALAKATPHGLFAGLCTTSPRRAARVRRQLPGRTVMLNRPTVEADLHLPLLGKPVAFYTRTPPDSAFM